MVIAHVREGVFSAYISALRPTLAPRRGPFFIAFGIADVIAPLLLIFAGDGTDGAPNPR